MTWRTSERYGRWEAISQRRSIFKILLDLRQENFLFSPTDLDFHTIAHDHGAAFPALVFFYMKEVDKKGLVDTQKAGIGEQPLIVEQRLGSNKRLDRGEPEHGIAPLRLTVYDVFQFHDRETFLGRQAKPHFQRGSRLFNIMK